MAREGMGAFCSELLDQLLAGRDPKAVMASGGLIDELEEGKGLSAGSTPSWTCI